MKGAICYYSGSGNTKLACDFLTTKIKQLNFEMFNIVKSEKPDFRKYDIVGFAFPTFYLGVPEIFLRFITNAVIQNRKPAFLLNTYGMMQGQALKNVNKVLDKKGFHIIAWHALMMPENYPPFIAKGWCSENQPDEKQMIAFNRFILNLSDKLDCISKGAIPEKSKVRIGFFNSLMGVKSKDQILKELGEFKVEASLCNQCGKCIYLCCYNAIKLESKPVFKTEKCWGCWSCFNNCPQKAIYTDSVNVSAQYRGPDIKLYEKLGLN